MQKFIYLQALKQKKITMTKTKTLDICMDHLHI